MRPSIHNAVSHPAPPRAEALSPWRLALADGLLAAGMSGAVLAWRGRRELGSAAATLNAPSHWLWGDEALRRNALTWRYTGSGTTVHAGSALLWAVLYRLLRTLRRQPARHDALADAAIVTAVAAVVDLKLVPRRLTPGFERRLSRSGLTWVYAGFAAGLALGGLAALARRQP